MTIGPDPFRMLGELLTESECTRLIGALRAGETTAQVLKELHPSRRADVRAYLTEAGLGHENYGATRDVLAAIAGARSAQKTITPVWTMPGATAKAGRLTSEVQRLIDQARISVVCSSYNFSPTSQMWTALRAASERDGVAVTVYLDADKSDTDAVAAHLPRATVFRPITLPSPSQPIVNHAKFIIIDRTIVLLTSANFSRSAENTNIELGLLVEDATVAESIETQMRALHGVLYNRA